MDTTSYIEFIPKFISKLESDGISYDIMEVSKWITDYFKEYCLENNIEFIDLEVIHNFYTKRFGYNINEAKCNVQFVIRRPLLILMEYYQTGTYLKTHFKNNELLIPQPFINIFYKLKSEYIDTSNLSKNRKSRKTNVIAFFFTYLNEKKISNLSNLTISDVSEYIEIIKDKYAPESLRTIKGILRETFNWLYLNDEISFTGNQAFPIIRKCSNEKILTTYTEEEISKILNTVDNSSKKGKLKYAVLCLLVYYGLRAGDIQNLKFENISFEKGYIRLIQQKTKNELTLPLIDEVKMPLIDYIKNGRNKSLDKDYIFITMEAPFTRYTSSNFIYPIVTEAMEKAGVNYENKKHGSHSLRHSLATNMINENIPIEDISAILGHENIKTTEIYITKDITHLKELTLEMHHE